MGRKGWKNKGGETYLKSIRTFRRFAAKRGIKGKGRKVLVSIAVRIHVALVFVPLCVLDVLLQVLARKQL